MSMVISKRGICIFVMLVFGAWPFTQASHAQITQVARATIVYTGGGPDVNNLDGKEAKMTIVWAADTTWFTVSNLQQAISESTTFTIDGQDVVFPSNELPLIYNIVNSVNNRLAYADVNENVILNFTVFGVDSSTRARIHPDNPLTVTSGTLLEVSHVDRGVDLLDVDGHFTILDVGGADYTYASISNEVFEGSVLFGDVNLDCTVNLLDVEPFIDLLTSGTFQIEADINEDDVVNLLDVEGFIALLTG